MHILPRDGGGGLSTSTIIVIAVVCGAVGILVLTLFLWRLVARLFHRESPAPLPPVQALAHHREAQLAAFASRPTTWMDGSINGRSRHFLHPTSSSVSLIPGTPERKSSFYTDENTTAESAYSLSSPPLPHDDNDLPVPHPRFFGPPTGISSPHASLHSMASSTASSDASTPPGGLSPSPSGSVPGSTHELAPEPIVSIPSSQSFNRNTRIPPEARPASRTRPMSMISLSGSVHSAHTMRSNGTTIRGTPHGPLSNVQIILPTPLAPQVHPYMHPLVEGSFSNMDFSESARSSVVDQWVAVGGPGNTSNANRKKQDHRTSLGNNAQRRSHKRPSSFARSASPLGMSSRSLSQPRSSTSSPSIPFSATLPPTISPARSVDPLPPVPPIPFTQGAEISQPPSLQNLAEAAERGRLRPNSSISSHSIHQKPLPGEPQSPPQPSRVPSHKGRTLRKPKPANVS